LNNSEVKLGKLLAVTGQGFDNLNAKAKESWSRENSKMIRLVAMGHWPLRNLLSKLRVRILLGIA
jgi:hypothetical protein